MGQFGSGAANSPLSFQRDRRVPGHRAFEHWVRSTSRWSGVDEKQSSPSQSRLTGPCLGEIFTLGCASVDYHQGTMCACAVPVFFCFSSVSFLGSIKQGVRDHVGLSISDRASDDWGVQRSRCFLIHQRGTCRFGTNFLGACCKKRRRVVILLLVSTLPIETERHALGTTTEASRMPKKGIDTRPKSGNNLYCYM